MWFVRVDPRGDIGAEAGDGRIATNWHLEDNLNAAQAARRHRTALKIRSVRGTDRQHARKLVELCVAWRARLTLKLIG